MKQFIKNYYLIAVFYLVIVVGIIGLNARLGALEEQQKRPSAEQQQSVLHKSVKN